MLRSGKDRETPLVIEPMKIYDCLADGSCIPSDQLHDWKGYCSTRKAFKTIWKVPPRTGHFYPGDLRKWPSEADEKGNPNCGVEVSEAVTHYARDPRIIASMQKQLITIKKPASIFQSKVSDSYTLLL